MTRLSTLLRSEGYGRRFSERLAVPPEIRKGQPVDLRVTVTNTGDEPAGGDVVLTSPHSWRVQPPSVPFGRIGNGESQIVRFDVTVPEGTPPGRYGVEATVTSRREMAEDSGAIDVIGDLIEFSPGTEGEEPWLFDADGSALGGPEYDGSARFSDNERYFVYRLQLPSDVTGGTLSLEIANQFLVEGSAGTLRLEAHRDGGTLLLAEIPRAREPVA